jgi:hypothetical protein
MEKNFQKMIFLLFIVLISSNNAIRKLYPSEIIVNTNTNGNQTNAGVQVLGNDNIVITWKDGQTGKLELQIYDSNADPVGSSVVGGFLDIPYRKYIEAIGNNRFVIVYNNAGSLNAQIYNPDGSTFGSMFQVNNDTGGLHEATDIAVLTNGNFVILYNTSDSTYYYKIYDSTGNLVTPNSVLVVDNVSEKVGAVMKISSGGAFIICWKSSGNILCRFFDSNGAVSSNISVDSFNANQNSARNPSIMAIDRLSNGDFVVAYGFKQGNWKLAFAVVGADLTVKKSRTIVSTEVYSNPSVATLSSGKFIITYDGATCGSCNTYVYSQIFNADYSAYGLLNPTNMIVDTTTDHSNPMVAALVNDRYIIVFQSLNLFSPTSGFDIYMNTWTAMAGVQCQDFQTPFVKSQTTETIDISPYVMDDNITGLQVKFNSLPVNSLKLLGSNVNISNSYLYNSQFTYVTGSQSDALSYYVIDADGNISSICTITINVCYSVCETCNVSGNISNHQCQTCKSALIQLGSNCYQSCPYNGGYNYYDTVTHSCTPCISPCSDCSDKDTCVTCSNGYYLLEGQIRNNCITECPKGYWLDGRTCRKCNPLCAECSGTAGNCSSCISSYLVKDLNQCINSCPPEYPLEGGSCQECNSTGQCVSKNCRSNQILLRGTCTDCLGFIYNNQCLTACPFGTTPNSVNKTCNTCDSLGLLFYNGQCVNTCPEGYCGEGSVCSICSEDQGVYKKVSDCSSITCLNGGICQISFNNVLCKCDSRYTGSICQQLVTSLNNTLGNI